MQLAPALPESIAAMLTSLSTAASAAQTGTAAEVAGEAPAPTFSELLSDAEEQQEAADQETAEGSDAESLPTQALPVPQQNVRVNTLPWHFAAPAFTAPEVHGAPADSQEPATETPEVQAPTVRPLAADGLVQTAERLSIAVTAAPATPEAARVQQTTEQAKMLPEHLEHTGYPEPAEQLDVPEVPLSAMEQVPAATPSPVPVAAPVQSPAPQPIPAESQAQLMPDVRPETPVQNTTRVAAAAVTSIPGEAVEIPPSIFEPVNQQQAHPADDTPAPEPEMMRHIRVAPQPASAEAPKPVPQAPAPPAADLPSAPAVYVTDAEPAPQEKRESRPQPLAATAGAEQLPAEHTAFSGRIEHPATAVNPSGGEAPRAPERPQHLEAPQPVRLPPETPEAPRTPLRTLTVTVEPQPGAERADIHFVHRNGVVDMAVRATSPELARVLRSDLPELVRDLEQQGFSSDLDSGERHPEGRSRRQYERKDDDD